MTKKHKSEINWLQIIHYQSLKSQLPGNYQYNLNQRMAVILLPSSYSNELFNLSAFVLNCCN